MCGIAGYTGPIVPGRLESMLSRITHRGPDDQGALHSGNYHIGMRRLTILDAEGGKQPMLNADETIAIIFNGEIYNAPELRRELEAQGQVFQSSHSDTEVLLHLFDRKGIEFVDALNGMFAICILDRKNNELYLIRDRFGKKPLFYSFIPEQRSLQFCSEFQGLDIDADANSMDRDAFEWFFFSKSMESSRTTDLRIKQVPPGSYLKLGKDTPPELTRYYRIPSVRRSPADLNESEICDELDRLFTDAVKLRMRSDVEVGAFLSGGLDSSLVVTRAARFSDRPLKTFCLVYDDEIYNKSSDRHFAEMISQSAGTIHHEVLLTPDRFINELPRIVSSMAQPYAGSVASWFVSQAMAEQGLKVTLTGDGADETFGSYFLHRVAAGLASPPVTSTPLEKRFMDMARQSSFGKVIDAFAIFSDKEQNQLLSSRSSAENGFTRLIDSHFSETDPSFLLTQMLRFEFEHFLPEIILTYIDRLSMGNSLEVRSPFLDHRIVEFLFSLPDPLKIRNGETKFLLKKMATRHLPGELIHRQKEGFIEPAVHWLGNELKDFARSVLHDKEFDRFGILNREYVKQLSEDFFATNDFFLGKKLWTLVMYGLWERGKCPLIT